MTIIFFRIVYIFKFNMKPIKYYISTKISLKVLEKFTKIKIVLKKLKFNIFGDYILN